MCSHLHPAVRPADGPLRSQAAWGTGLDTAALRRWTVGLQQSSTGPGKSERQTGQNLQSGEMFVREKKIDVLHSLSVDR